MNSSINQTKLSSDSSMNYIQNTPAFLMKTEVQTHQNIEHESNSLNNTIIETNNLSTINNINKSKLQIADIQTPIKKNLKDTQIGNNINSSNIGKNFETGINLEKSREIELEAKVERISQKLNKLETRVENDEKITLTTKEDIRDLRINLDANFNKLDTILEKIATKLK